MLSLLLQADNYFTISSSFERYLLFASRFYSLMPFFASALTSATFFRCSSFDYYIVSLRKVAAFYLSVFSVSRIAYLTD
jgi:hypothetical protein